MKVYVSGKIGKGVPDEETLEKFKMAEDLIRSRGHEVFNPTTSGLGVVADQKENYAHVIGKRTTWYAEILKLDLNELSFCDAICMLPDWTDSPGAMTELYFAKAIGIMIVSLSDFNQ
ncbi:MAG: DUF4406 domain-containing protein [Prevotella sp.]|nr:DUF4406 domain-containing protein [Prevotella sp.]